ncbi:cytochrome c5 family protein [Paenalcaligenes hominis]|uniref:c-type cytochrome n=1 Tax=Paenalcaligenes hominis TaxID=643674 RepID=UPI003525DA65
MSLTEQQPHNNDSKSTIEVKNPARIFWLSILFLVVVGAAMYYIDINTNDLRTGKSRSDHTESVSARIQPVAKFALAVVEGDLPLKSGKEVYDTTCTTCHAASVAGAPKFGDSAAWAPYIQTGYEAMLQVALNGKGAMPAKGGNTALEDIEVERAMVYMANAAGANFDEPTDGDDVAAEKSDAAPAEATAADTAPAADTAAAGNDIPAATADQLANGKKLYDAACFACHGSGVAGAPKFGDNASWAPYIETGLDTMLQIAIAGKGAMPPRGTAMNASDDDLRDAILYMIEDAR